MREQLNEDFQNYPEISKEQVDATFSSSSNPYLVRYRVVEGVLYRYFPEGEAIALQDNSTEKALKTAIHFGKIKNMDFILSYLDGISSNQKQAPIFSPAKQGFPMGVILVPDWRSISSWWKRDQVEILSLQGKTPWEEKQDRAVWRGSFTKAIRERLCEISEEHPEILNAKVSIKTADEADQKRLEERGFFGEMLHFPQFLQYKFLPTVDGVCCAYPSLQWKLLSDSVTFKQDSDEVQWFYRGLKPFVHYIPVKNDLSDLVEKIAWAKEHDAECKQIAERGTQFAQANLMMEDVYLYLYLALKKYASLQKNLNSQLLKKEIDEDARWINTQDRKPLRKAAKKAGGVGYLKVSSPHIH